MIDARQATRLVSCPSFDPMPFRHSDEFSDWLVLSKIKIGRWNPGLFRDVTPSDVSLPESRWDRAPATPSISGTHLQDSNFHDVANLEHIISKQKDGARNPP